VKHRRFIVADISGAIVVLDTDETPAVPFVAPMFNANPIFGMDKESVVQRAKQVAHLLNQEHEMQQAINNALPKAPPT